MSTKPNAELAWRVIDHIDAHPQSWDQEHWVCGTSACFAGWAVRLSGAEIAQIHEDVIDSAIVIGGPQSLIELPVDEAAEMVLRIGRHGPHGDYIDVRQAGDLFAGGNTREDLGHLVAKIFGPRPMAGGGRS